MKLERIFLSPLCLIALSSGQYYEEDYQDYQDYADNGAPQDNLYQNYQEHQENKK